MTGGDSTAATSESCDGVNEARALMRVQRGDMASLSNKKGTVVQVVPFGEP